MSNVRKDSDKADAFATALCEHMRAIRESSPAEKSVSMDDEATRSQVFSVLLDILKGATEELKAKDEEDRFLFPDEIREILRDCDDRTRIGIYDVTDGEWMEVYNYEIRLTQNSVRYLSRYGTKVSEEDLAGRLYDAIEDGYTVTINGTDIFERWE